MIEALEKAWRDRMVAGTALAALLSGSAAIYQGWAPANAEYDFCVIDFDYTTDNSTHGRGEDIIVSVRSCSNGGKSTANAIDAQVEDLFHEKPLSMSGWTDFWCARRRGFSIPEHTPGDQVIWYAVAEYDVWLEEG